jgi:antitoxin component YwqK of YwqJK toxin-antitoxin module
MTKKIQQGVMAGGNEWINYVNDKRDGKWFVWYWHGQIKTEVNYINGNLEGRQTEYFENGQIDMEGIFKDDIYLRNGRGSGTQP